jgi:pimeloyl-ACP methyl ester carboxylesterase
MPTVDLPHGAVYYREKGAGPALVLLMGTGADHTSWARQFTPLAERFRVIAPDNRGSGRSLPPPPPGYGVADFAAETLEFLSRLGVDRFHVAGFSFGAAVAMEVAWAGGARVASASFHAGWAGPNASTSAALGRSLAVLETEGVEAFLLAACRRNFSPAFQHDDPAVFASFLKNVVQSATRPTLAGVLAQARAGAAHDIRDRLPSLRLPVLVTTGEHDPLAGPAVAEEIASLVPGAKLRIFRGPRAYHALPLEIADEFNAALLDFHGGAA